MKSVLVLLLIPCALFLSGCDFEIASDDTKMETTYNGPTAEASADVVYADGAYVVTWPAFLGTRLGDVSASYTLVNGERGEFLGRETDGALTYRIEMEAQDGLTVLSLHGSTGQQIAVDTFGAGINEAGIPILFVLLCFSLFFCKGCVNMGDGEMVVFPVEANASLGVTAYARGSNIETESTDGHLNSDGTSEIETAGGGEVDAAANTNTGQGTIPSTTAPTTPEEEPEPLQVGSLIRHPEHGLCRVTNVNWERNTVTFEVDAVTTATTSIEAVEVVSVSAL